MTDEKIMATIKPDGECWQPEIDLVFISRLCLPYYCPI